MGLDVGTASMPGVSRARKCPVAPVSAKAVGIMPVTFFGLLVGGPVWEFFTTLSFDLTLLLGSKAGSRRSYSSSFFSSWFRLLRRRWGGL